MTSNITYLSTVKTNKTVKVISTLGCNKFKERLLSMGIKIGDIIKVFQNHFHGPVIVIKENNKIILGYGIANKIIVNEVNYGKKNKNCISR